MIKKLFLLSFVFVLSVGVGSAFAIPALQLYIEGSTYDVDTETWAINSSNFTLWVLGNVGGVGTIEDVRLAFAHDSSENGSITFTPIRTSLLTDLTTPSDPALFASGSDDSPIIGVNPNNGNNNYLPSHSIYGPGIDWEVYKLGNFDSIDSPIGNYSPSNCPDGSCSDPTSGQINAYTIDISGYTWVHFDTYSYNGPFAPFSHDTGATPEPSTLILLGSGLLGMMARRKKLLINNHKI